MENHKITLKILSVVALSLFPIVVCAKPESALEKYLSLNPNANRDLLLNIQHGNIVCFLIAIVCIAILWWKKTRSGKERKNSLTYIYSIQSAAFLGLLSGIYMLIGEGYISIFADFIWIVYLGFGVWLPVITILAVVQLIHRTYNNKKGNKSNYTFFKKAYVLLFAVATATVAHCSISFVCEIIDFGRCEKYVGINARKVNADDFEIAVSESIKDFENKQLHWNSVFE